jgi:hypothetical protein
MNTTKAQSPIEKENNGAKEVWYAKQHSSKQNIFLILLYFYTKFINTVNHNVNEVIFQTGPN